MGKKRLWSSGELGKGPTGRSACSVRAVAGTKRGTS